MADDMRSLPGLKQRDLTPCALCRRGVMHAGKPWFYVLSIAQAVVDLNAVRRQHGLETMLGAGGPLAQVFGPDDDMAKEVARRDKLLICADCAMETPSVPLAVLMDEDDG